MASNASDPPPSLAPAPALAPPLSTPILHLQPSTRALCGFRRGSNYKIAELRGGGTAWVR